MYRACLIPVLLIATARQACCDKHVDSPNDYATTVFEDYPIAAHTTHSYIYGLNPGGAEVYVSGGGPQHHQPGKPFYDLGPERDGHEDHDVLKSLGPDDVDSSYLTGANTPSSPGSDDGRPSDNGDEEVIFPEPCESITDKNVPDPSDSTESGNDHPSEDSRYLSAGSDEYDPDYVQPSAQTLDEDGWAPWKPYGDGAGNYGPNKANGLENSAADDDQSHGINEGGFVQRSEGAFSLSGPASSSDDDDERDVDQYDHFSGTLESGLLDSSDNMSSTDSTEPLSTGNNDGRVFTDNSPLPRLSENGDTDSVELGNDAHGGEDFFSLESDSPTVSSDRKNTPIPLTPAKHVPHNSIKGHGHSKGKSRSSHPCLPCTDDSKAVNSDDTGSGRTGFLACLDWLRHYLGIHSWIIIGTDGPATVNRHDPPLLEDLIDPISLDPHVSPVGTIPTAVRPTRTPHNSVTTLKPCVWYDHDTADLVHLKPKTNNKLYFSENGKANPESTYTFAALNGKSTEKVVVLDHSRYIFNLSCSNDGFSLQFSNMEALKYAETYWHGSFVAVVSTLDCDEDPHNPQNTFWRVKSVSFDGKTRTAKLLAEKIDIDTVFGDVTLSWGRNDGLRSDDDNNHLEKPGRLPGSNGGVALNDSDDNQPNKPSWLPGSNDNGTNEPSWLPGSSGGVLVNSNDASNNASNNVSTYPPSCGAAPAASIDGFPAAACGPGFDDALDSALGYLTFDDADFLQSLRAFLPGIIDVLTTNSSTSNDDSLTRRRRRRRRALSHISAARAHLRVPRGLPDSLAKIGVAAVQSKLANGALQAIQSAAAGQGVLAQAASWVEGALGWLQDALGGSSSASGGGRGRTQTVPISRDFSVNIGPRPAQLVDSGYWGRAYPILLSRNNATGDASSPASSVDLYCVDCRVRGNAHVAGQIQYTIGTRNLSIGRVSLGGSLEASFGLGLATDGGPYQGSVYKTIASLPMNAFTIPSLLSIGPVLSLDANLTVDAISGGAGQVLFGAKASIPNYGVSFDILRNSNFQGNFAPVLTPNFQTNGTVNTVARLSVPLKMSLKIEVPAVKWNKTISVVNEPYLRGLVTDSSANCTDSAAYSVQVGDNAHVDIFGFGQFDLNTDRSIPPKTGCVQTSNSTLAKRQDAANATQTQQAADSIPPSLASDSNNFGGDGILDGQEMADLMDFTINKGKTDDPTSSKKPPPHDSSSFAYSKIRLHTSINSSAPWHLYANPSGTFSLRQQHNPTQPHLHHRRATNDDDADDPLPIDAGDDIGFYFGHAGGIACTDPAGRLMYFFPSTMAAHGVSRLRFATQFRIPHDASFVALAAGGSTAGADRDGGGDEDKTTTTSTPDDGLMMAVDSLGNGFYPVACGLDGVVNKVFLVRDLEDGVRRLEAEELRHVVTGGVVSGCAPLALYLVKEG